MKRVLALYDRPGWAFHRTGAALAKALPQYDWTLWPCNEIDRVNREHWQWDVILSLGWKWTRGDIRTPAEKTVASIASHRTFDGKPPREWAGYLAERYCRLGATNPRLEEEVAESGVKTLFATNGVDADFFCPGPARTEGKIVAGWSGWGNDPDFRGIPIMREACARAGVELRLNEAMRNRLGDKELREFYRGLDVYLCMSETEGCSMSMLEAAACGVPCISTDVGCARRMFSTGGGFIVDRSVDHLTAQLRRLTQPVLVNMSRKIRAQVCRAWTWAAVSIQWAALLEGEKDV